MTRRKCAHLGCDVPADGRGLCHPHYMKLLRAAERHIRVQRTRDFLRSKVIPLPRTGIYVRRSDHPPWVDYEQLAAAMADPALLDRASDWRAGAMCRRSTVDMFPESPLGSDHAKAVCATCDVVYECLAYAVMTSTQTDDIGVWGGTTKLERVQVRKRLAVIRAQEREVSA